MRDFFFWLPEDVLSSHQTLYSVRLLIRIQYFTVELILDLSFWYFFYIARFKSQTSAINSCDNKGWQPCSRLFTTEITCIASRLPTANALMTLHWILGTGSKQSVHFPPAGYTWTGWQKTCSCPFHVITAADSNRQKKKKKPAVHDAKVSLVENVHPACCYWWREGNNAGVGAFPQHHHHHQQQQQQQQTGGPYLRMFQFRGLYSLVIFHIQH